MFLILFFTSTILPLLIFPVAVSNSIILYLIILLFLMIFFQIKNPNAFFSCIDPGNTTWLKIKNTNLYIAMSLIWSLRLIEIFGIQSLYMVAHYTTELTDSRLYGLTFALILILRIRSQSIILTLIELTYGLYLAQKLIILLSIITIITPWAFDMFQKRGLNTRQKFLWASIIVSLSIILWGGFRLLVSFLRTGQINVSFSEYLESYLRLTSHRPFILYDQIFKTNLHPDYMCNIVGRWVPDYLFELPLICKNIDENIKFFNLDITRRLDINDITERSLIDHDLLLLYSEPYVIFGLAGSFIFIGFFLWVTFIWKALSEGERFFGNGIISVSLIDPATSFLFLMSKVFIFLWLIFGLRFFAFITTISSSRKYKCSPWKGRSKCVD